MEKERRTKALLLSTLVVVVATLSIAFAAMSRTLSINGIGKMDTASWSVYFANLGNAKITRGAEEVGKPKISDDKGTLQDINVKLSNPKDEISYTVDIVNDGTIDAEITMIKDIELTDVQKKVFEFKVTYTATGEVLKNGDLLPKDTTKNITISIKFKDDITEFDLPTESQTINLSYQITYTQYDGGNSDLPTGPNGGDINRENVFLANDSDIFDNLGKNDNEEDVTFFNGTIARGTVESIDFLNSNIVPSEYASIAWDASQNSDGSIMAWYADTDNNELYEVYVGSNGNINAPANSRYLFFAFVELKQINLSNNFYTSETIDMSHMFGQCYMLEQIDVSNFNTINVTTMTDMFADCESLASLDLSNFKTINVTDMSGMFSDCTSLTSLDLNSFDTTNVEYMSYMFGDCSSLTSLNVTSFNTSNVEEMESMFASCNSITNLNLSSFRTDSLKYISYMFEYLETTNITVDLRNADFSGITNYSNIFDEASISNFVLIVDETQKDLATNIFVTSQSGNYATVTIKTPSEL